MSKHVLAGFALSALAATAIAEQSGPSYHEVIQGDTITTPVKEFEKLESEAYTGFDGARVYPPLIKAYAATSERIWAVIYGEVFANLTDDERLRAEFGALVFRLYDEAIDVKSAEQMNVSLTREWVVDADNPVLPFEADFEMTAILGMVTAGTDRERADFMQSLEPLTIGALAAARERHLAIWREKKLPETELVRWQERIQQAGHFAAYSHWLFQAARPAEFERWQRSNRAGYDAWIRWRTANPMRLHVPDFQRPLLSAKDPELELLIAGRALLTRNNPVEALRKSFDKVVQRFEARHADDDQTYYCARSPEEALIYLATAATAAGSGSAARKKSASILPPTWSDAYYLKAYALLELGRLGEARESLERAITLSPGNSMYKGELAYTFQAEKRWAEALARFEEAEEAAEMFSPDEVKASEISRALRGQGYALVELGRLDEAEAIYRRAIAADPEDGSSAGEIQYIEKVRAQQQRR